MYITTKTPTLTSWIVFYQYIKYKSKSPSSYPSRPAFVYSLYDATFGLGFTIGPVFGAMLFELRCSFKWCWGWLSPTFCCLLCCSNHHHHHQLKQHHPPKMCHHPNYFAVALSCLLLCVAELFYLQALYLFLLFAHWPRYDDNNDDVDLPTRRW